jgi:S1-C subfamily serine protease
MNQTLPVAAPLDTDFAGQGAQAARASIMRVMNPKAGMIGTGFLHSSGRVLTAEHVVRGAGQTDITLWTSQGAQIQSTSVHVDARVDLATVEPATSLTNLSALPLSAPSTFTVGTMLSAWGYPGGYFGLTPLLTVGYLAGSDNVNGVTRYVVNAAFNSGNSGGPLLHLETGAVIGVVASKLAPLPPQIQSLLDQLAQQKFGLQWGRTLPDGTTGTVSEAQVVAEVLQFLRSQTQLVVGHAVVLEDLRQFWVNQGLAP